MAQICSDRTIGIIYYTSVIVIGMGIVYWGQGVDSVSNPGPSIHPIMSLKIYILLYTYVTYYGIN